MKIVDRLVFQKDIPVSMPTFIAEIKRKYQFNIFLHDDHGFRLNYELNARSARFQ